MCNYALQYLPNIEQSFINIFFVFQTYFLPIIGLVEAEDLTPGDLVVSLNWKFHPSTNDL